VISCGISAPFLLSCLIHLEGFRKLSHQADDIRFMADFCVWMLSEESGTQTDSMESTLFLCKFACIQQFTYMTQKASLDYMQYWTLIELVFWKLN